MSQFREDNKILEVFETFPWLNNSIHRVGEIGAYLMALSKYNDKDGLHLNRYICSSMFDIQVLEYLKDGFIEFSLRGLPNGQVIWTAIFQPNNNTFILASIGQHPVLKKSIVSLEMYMTSFQSYYNFLESIADLVFDDKPKSVGFVS